MPKYKTATSLNGLKEIVSGTKADGARFMQKYNGLNHSIAAQRAKFQQNLELADMTGKGLQEQVQKSMSGFAPKFRRENSDELRKLYDELSEAQQAISYASKHMVTSKHLATAFMIGTEERSRMEAQISGMGKGALVALAEKAKAEAHTPSGKLMATVIIEANDRLAAHVRPLDSFALADACFAGIAKEAAANIKEVQLELDRAKILLTEFTTGKPIDPISKITVGLNHVEEVLPGDAPPSENRETDVWDSHTKLMKGMEEKRKNEPSFEETWAAVLKEAEAA